MILVLGVASIALLVVTDQIRERLLAPRQAEARLVEQARTRLAIAHLWVEEHVTGDLVDLGEIEEQEAGAAALVSMFLDGGRPFPAGPVLQPLTDPGLRGRAVAVQARIAEFRDMTHRRLAGFTNGEDVGIGSAIDRQFDDAFNTLLSDLGSLGDLVEERLVDAHRRSRLLFRTIAFVWIGIVTLAVAGLWTRERQRHAAERALEASQEQLLRSQRLDSLGRLSGGLAHDINNYLAAINAQCEVLSLEPGSEERVREKMALVMGTVERASRLIQQLLAFSRRRPSRPRTLNLRQVIGDLTPMFSDLLGARIRLETRAEDGPFAVTIDPAHVEQVLVNLLLNARDAMPEGGTVEVTIRHLALGPTEAAGVGLGPGDYVRLRVRDTGSGIEPELIDRIFDPFVSGKSGADHSGLGLATVHGIATQHEGAVSVSSRPGSGATFDILLPASRRPADEPSTSAPIETSHAETGSRRVLLVEDHDDVRAATKAVLEALGHAVVSAADGLEALEILTSEDGESFDLLLTDVVMPGMDGRELARRARILRPEMAILLMTGFMPDAPEPTSRQADSPDVLSKPFTRRQLADRIRQLGL